PAAPPVYDWRELDRWKIPEALLPLGADLRFRQPSLWIQYWPQICVVGGVIALQAILISILLYEHRGRRVAESQAKERLMQVAGMDRALAASAMSASISHELRQPLSAILSNSEAARMILKQDQPDMTLIDEILSDIIRDNDRAIKIIARLRGLLGKDRV